MSQTKLLQTKHIISVMKNSYNQLINRLELSVKRISKTWQQVDENHLIFNIKKWKKWSNNIRLKYIDKNPKMWIKIL